MVIEIAWRSGYKTLFLSQKLQNWSLRWKQRDTLQRTAVFNYCNLRHSHPDNTLHPPAGDDLGNYLGWALYPLILFWELTLLCIYPNRVLLTVNKHVYTTTELQIRVIICSVSKICLFCLYDYELSIRFKLYRFVLSFMYVLFILYP